MSSHTTKRCSWHEYRSACAAGHTSGVSCSLCWVWEWEFIVQWDTFVLGDFQGPELGHLRATQMCWVCMAPIWDCRAGMKCFILLFLHKDSKQWGPPISPSPSVVFCPIKGNGKKVRSLFQKWCLHITALHRRAGDEQEICPSAQTE